LDFEKWIVPAFGIPIRNPAVANNPSGLESWPAPGEPGHDFRKKEGNQTIKLDKTIKIKSLQIFPKVILPSG